MSVYYQASPPASPPRTYFPSSPRRGSSFGYFGSPAGSVSYAPPYTDYVSSQTPAPYYSPSVNGGAAYYQPSHSGVPYQVTLAQPQYTTPMVYSYLAPRSNLFRLYRGRHRRGSHHNYYGDDDCCGCGNSGRGRGGMGCWSCCCGDDGRYDTRPRVYGGYEEDGCCGCYGRSSSGGYYHGGRRHRREDDCCMCC